MLRTIFSLWAIQKQAVDWLGPQAMFADPTYGHSHALHLWITLLHSEVISARCREI